MKNIMLIAACLLFSCQKPIAGDINAPGSNSDANAKVIWTGPVEADGCGWALLINDAYYHPDSLPDEFQQDQLNVVVTYEATKAIFPCGVAGSGYPLIEVRSIKKA